MSLKSVYLLSLIAPTVLAVSPAYAQTPPPADAAPAPAEPKPEPPKPEPSWFVRPPFVLTVGEGKAAWKLQIYGFAEADFMNDSTRSFNDGMNSNLVAHSGTLAGDNGRTQFTIRNSRIGFEIKAPEVGGIKASGKLEGDFFGYDPPAANSGVGTTSEAGFFNNPTFRIRHAYVKLESEAVDLQAGQMYHLFGWQNSYLICSAGFLGIPNEIFGRTQMFRLSHTFKSDSVNVELSVAAVRPVQRDSQVPDGEGGLRVLFNKWKGITTPGSGGTAANPAALAVSGLVRQFKVDEFAAKPVNGNKATGWAIAAQALIPIIPAADSNDRSNALTLLGEFTVGTGYADQFTGMTGGANFPALPNAAGTMPAPTYTPDVDNGLVTYDTTGALHTIDWRTFVVGLQYYVPPGRLILSANYSHADSKNMTSFFTTGAAIQKSQYFDGNVFFDTTPSSRLGVSYQYVKQTSVDNTESHNNRYEVLALYFF